VRKKRISSQDKLNNLEREKSGMKSSSKPAMKIAAYNRKPLRMKYSQKQGLETNRNRLKLKEKITQETPPQRGKSEEQKFDEFLMNESEPEETYPPKQEERERLI
jgi:hypothetical protein